MTKAEKLLELTNQNEQKEEKYKLGAVYYPHAKTLVIDLFKLPKAWSQSL